MGLRIGAIEVAVPVVLAPMAGITNPAYRSLCREQAEAGAPDVRPAGLFVCEMITSRGIVERIPKTFDMLRFDDADPVKSVQLYGVDPAVIATATAILCGELGIDHIDLNFGCPVPKVTRRGGGGVLPWKRDRLEAILRAAVKAAAPYGVPVTMKTRKGIDDDHLTYLDAGRIAEQAGVAAVALHGRTVAQAYGGDADWEAIAQLVDAVSIPVLGNGDIWEAGDAVRMMRETGAAGVVVGRGCLGRPWLFRDLAARLRPGGSDDGPTLPTLGEVMAMVRRHGELLAETHGERYGLTDLRKHMTWYFKGFGLGGELRHALGMVSSFVELDDLFARLDPGTPFPTGEVGTPRGRQGSPRERVTVPYGWLESRVLDDSVDLADAESDVSGG
ncbi:MAG: tRNA dihydrouridine synthase DusB [Propionibacteriaceae bacterium]